MKNKPESANPHCQGSFSWSQQISAFQPQNIWGTLLWGNCHTKEKVDDMAQLPKRELSEGLQ